MKKNYYYFDHAATSPMHAKASEAMQSCLNSQICNANPSSNMHELGRKSAQKWREAHESFASLLGVAPSSLVFTSGASESNAWILRHFAEKKARLLTTAMEHGSINRGITALAMDAVKVLGDSSKGGHVDAACVQKAVFAAQSEGKPFGVASLIHGASELGTLNELEGTAKVLQEQGVVVHADLTQSLGKTSVPFEALDYASFSLHKLGGPKGFGCLYIHPNAPKPKALIFGAHQNAMRGGTLPLALLLGSLEALSITLEKQKEQTEKYRKWQKKIGASIEALGGKINTVFDYALPHYVHASFESVDVDVLRSTMPHICVSQASACASMEGGAPSNLLMALYQNPKRASQGVRISMGHSTTDACVDALIDALKTNIPLLEGTA